MKKLFIKIIILALLVCVTISALVILPPHNYDGFIAALLDKHRMLETVESPRIVLVGGSNMAFGVDSPKLQNKFGMRVVNTGLHAGMGLKYILDDVRPFIKKNDIIVIVPEYSHFYGLRSGEETLVETLDIYPKGISYLNASQVKNVISSFPIYLNKKFTVATNKLTKKPLFVYDKIYNRSAFNENGDMESHIGKESKDVSKMEFFPVKGDYDGKTIDDLNDFFEFASKKGARVYFDFPGIPEPHYKKNKDKVDYVYSNLKKQLKFPVMSTPENYVFPVSDFFDTVYHLNKTGRDERTAKFINDLEKYLNK